MKSFLRKAILVVAAVSFFTSINVYANLPETERLGWHFDSSDLFERSGITAPYAMHKWYDGAWNVIDNFEENVTTREINNILSETDGVMKISINYDSLNTLKMEDTSKDFSWGEKSNLIWEHNKMDSSSSNLWLSATNQPNVHWTCTIMMDKPCGRVKFGECLLFDSDGNIKIENGGINEILCKWEPDQWYTIDMLFNGLTGVGNFYVNGILTKEDVKFFDRPQNVNYTYMRIGYTENGEPLDYNLYLNNVAYGTTPIENFIPLADSCLSPEVLNKNNLLISEDGNIVYRPNGSVLEKDFINLFGGVNSVRIYNPDGNESEEDKLLENEAEMVEKLSDTIAKIYKVVPYIHLKDVNYNSSDGIVSFKAVNKGTENKDVCLMAAAYDKELLKSFSYTPVTLSADSETEYEINIGSFGDEINLWMVDNLTDMNSLLCKWVYSAE